MTPVECPREQEVVQVILESGWPGGAEETLLEHVELCPGCREVVNVATIFRMDREEHERDVRLPAAGLVWWRAAVRARMESAHTAGRPLTWIHGLAGACAAGIGFAVLAFAWPSVRSLAGRAAALVMGLDPASEVLAAPMMAMIERSLPLALGVAGCVVLAPLIVLYFALSGE